MKTEGLNVKALKIAILIFVVGCLYQRFHRPLPDDFSQPWKYRLICFGADLVINQMGRYLEAMGIVHRVNITRFSYHMAIGAFNIRDPGDGIQVVDEVIDNNMAVRIYRPYNPDYEHSRVHQNTSDFLAPTILFYHGGGFFVGSADTLEPVTYLMAKYTNYTVIYIEFRLIPEHKFPAALNDSYSTTLHLLRNHRKYNIDPDRLILMGDSAGGNLATVIGQKLSVDNVVKPKLQVLIYPLLQMFDFTLPSYRANLPQKVLGNIDHETFKHFLHYLTGYEVDDSVFANGHTSQAHKESHLSSYVNVSLLPEEFRVAAAATDGHLDHVRLNDTEEKYAAMAKILLSSDVSPLLVSDDHLAAHTPHNTLLITTGIDILRDDGFIYARRLKSLGLSIEHRHYESLFHGVFGLLHGLIEFDVAHDLVKQVVDHVKQTVY